MTRLALSWQSGSKSRGGKLEKDVIQKKPESKSKKDRHFPNIGEMDDWRKICNGTEVPVSDGYADQPYFVQADDGTLVLICTTGSGAEGESGQHVVCIRSEDNGTTWSRPVSLEPADGVEASYAVLLKVPGGRLYAFYNHNTDNIRRVPGDREAYPDGWCCRVDSLGYFVFKYSDDHGATWSAKRYIVPVREFEIDRENTANGEIRYFWNVGKPFSWAGKGYVPLHKVGGFGVDFFTRSEGVLLCSENILTESDPEKICFETLPDGEIGLRAPKGGGPIAEEQSFVVLSDGTFFCVYRTISGYSACCYSRDAGRTWTDPDYMRYPDGRRIKNPRAANFIWKLSENRYIYWFHNHSGCSYADRNPVWCLAAHEVEGSDGKELEFSQPEILLYADDITRRMSYPDLMELMDGSLLVSETEKQVVRLHRIPPDFVQKVCGQWETPPLPSSGDVIAEWNATDSSVMKPVSLPVFYDREGGWEMISGMDCRKGLSIELRFKAGAGPGFLMDNRKKNGRGFSVGLTADRKLHMAMNDGRSESCWTSCHPLSLAREHHVVINVDGGSKTISLVVDGLFCDGGKERQFGFGLLHPFFQSLNGGDLRLGTELLFCRIYGRALLTAEGCALNRQLAMH